MLPKMEPAANPSRQAAPGFVAQGFQRQNSLLRRLRPKLPTGKQLDCRDLAFSPHLRRAPARAFPAKHVVKRFAKHFFLLDAMWTQVKAVYLGMLRCQTLGERIVLVI